MKLLELRDAALRRLVYPLLFPKNKGFYVMDEDWKFLIVLDACRHDYFQKLYNFIGLDGELETRISRGSDTPSWLEENFKNRDCRDVVYVTANPFVNKIFGKKGPFHKIVPVWDFGWDDDYQTVLPETMVKLSLLEVRRNPEKRFIFHFIQPHYPFLTFKPHYGALERVRDNIKHGREMVFWKNKFFSRIYLEDVYMFYTDEELKLGYLGNLCLVMKVLKGFIKKLKRYKGRIVVTSDHGEMLGEKLHPLLPFKVYGHARCIRTEQLIKVPWLVVG
ncbi:hypothetical protein J7L33_04885 [Candidatus Bathyarchaeota archaeon]|nr:hypothetical protein [Candidatus Bathyarchaeota archaeon]